MEQLDLDYYKNLLLFAQPVNMYGFSIKQYKVRELLTKYKEFNRIRSFVYISEENFIKEERQRIKNAMFDVKEQLLMSYPNTGYELSYDLYDLTLYHPVINTMFIEFLNFFTYHKIELVSHIPALDYLKIVYDEDIKVTTLTRKQFNDMLNRFCILNYANELVDEKDRITKTDKAKEFDDRKRELESKFGFEKKEDVTFNSILSWLANDGYKHETLIYKTIYQIMDAFKRKNYMEYCHLINTARGNGICNMNEAELRKINNAFSLY